VTHDTSLISTIAISLAFAFVGGLLAARLRLSPLIGYLVAGIAVGPFTPGFVADESLAPQLADIGVILLMFGVGMHFSVRDLVAVRAIALPGAVAQIVVSTVLGMGIAHVWGWSTGAGLMFGLALSVASTVVVVRALEARGQLGSSDGRIAVGWLVVEDLVMVLALVLLPAFAETLGGHLPAHGDGAANYKLGATLAMTIGKLAVFVGVMLIGGTRLLPRLLKWVEQTGSRELFTLAVITLALGIGFLSAQLFGVSYALGAFFAGVVMNGSELSHRAATDLRPLQDAFAALFFVAVGMFFEPAILIEDPYRVLIVLALIVVGKSLAAFAIVWVLRHPIHTALTVSAALAQIGEFSFILSDLGVELGLMSGEAQQLILAGALASITLNPLLFALVTRLQPRRTLAARLRARPR
jgi:CPA2 family monovalent cation:H+ antiporter-2